MPVQVPCESYRKQLPTWEFLADVFEGLPAWSKRENNILLPTTRAQGYLPKLPNEIHYEDRFRRSPFDRKFARAISTFVSLIFNNGITFEVPPAFAGDWAHLDRAGNDAALVLPRLAIASQIYGHTFALLDSPPADPTIRTYQDYLNRGGRTYWRSLLPTQVINWEVELINGVECCTWAVIHFRGRERVGYSEVFTEYYQELFPDRWYLWEMVKTRSGAVVQQLVNSGPLGRLVGGRLVPYEHVPLFPIYGGEQLGVYESRSAHLDLAELNVNLYQQQSDHLFKLRRTCYPQPVRVGYMGPPKPLELGPSTAIDVPPGGSFFWAEPLALSLEQSRYDLERTERKIDFLSAEYLIKPADRQASSSVQLQAQNVSSSLHLFAIGYAAGVNRILQFHAGLRGLYLEQGITLNTEFYDAKAKDSNLLMAYSTLAKTLGDYPQLNPAQQEIVDHVRSTYMEKN